MSFQARLLATQRGGNLTVADLARWFARPDPTVRGWVRSGVEPGGGPLDREEAERLLAALERLIARGKPFPLVELSPSDKIAKLETIRAKIKL